MTEIDWVHLLADEDVEGVWNGLYQLISRHPAVRPLHFATDGAAVASPTEINADLAQELFLETFQKQRFEHYTKSKYKSSEIENEMAHIEVPNLVGARLRKRYPESFRMARRVSSLLKTSPRLVRAGDSGQDEAGQRLKTSRVVAVARRRKPSRAATKRKAAEVEDDDGFDALDVAPDEDAPAETSGKPRRRGMVNQVFGLREWPRGKTIRDAGHFTEAIKCVPCVAATRDWSAGAARRS